MSRAWWSRLFAVRPVRPRRDRTPRRPHVEWLGHRTALAGDGPANAMHVGLTGLGAAAIATPAEPDWFRLTVEETGRLSVLTDADPDTRTSLLGPDGQLLIQSDGLSAANRDDQIAQHLTPGTYFLRVEGLT